MADVRKTAWIWLGRFAALVVVAVLVYALVDFGWPSFYSPPSGGEVYEETGALYVIESKDWPMDRAEHIRDLTGRETEAFRLFIEQADYQELTAYKDQVNLPVVKIDGVYWFVYRSGLFRKEGGDSQWRKTIDGVSLTTDGDRHEIDWQALDEWYERER
ncbi:MAG: hypothetical protein H6841_09740 [Planctomycetes bacterium]|nr:hypothetical protein [Planctomycetota bacterium]MCB9935669.1 hypothetical protein [Planctomycetota bacterium]